MSTVFPQAVIADKFVFLSGTPGLVPSTGKLGESFECPGSKYASGYAVSRWHISVC